MPLSPLAHEREFVEHRPDVRLVVDRLQDFRETPHLNARLSRQSMGGKMDAFVKQEHPTDRPAVILRNASGYRPEKTVVDLP